MSDFKAQPWKYGNLSEIIDLTKNKPKSSQDYFEMLAEGLSGFIQKKTEEDIDTLRSFLGYDKPQKNKTVKVVVNN